MNTFRKEERLCSKKSLDLLFSNGSSFLLYPFRVSYFFVERSEKFPVQVVINVAKKRYKNAVDRNFIKRRTRDAYRLQKKVLYSNLIDKNKLLLLSFQFVGKNKYAYSFIEKKIGSALDKLILNINADIN